MQNFHEERKKQLVALVEQEPWNVCDVPMDFQRILDYLCRGLEVSPSDVDIPEQPPALEKNTSELGSVDAQSLSSRKSIYVNDQRFFVTGSGLLLLKLISDYRMCLFLIPNSGGILIDCLTDLLKVCFMLRIL